VNLALNNNLFVTLLGCIIVDFFFFGQTAWSGPLSPLPSGVTELDTSYTNIIGGLEEETFADASNLNYIFLSGATFNSTVPSILGSLTNLQYLYLTETFLRGDLSYMEGMPRIFEHWNDLNRDLTGPIYSFIGELNTLGSFSVTEASLTGTLPTELGNLDNMFQMWFYDNQLTGTIPSEIGNLVGMRIFQVQENLLTGAVPDDICGLFSGIFSVLEVFGADCDELSVSTFFASTSSLFRVVRESAKIYLFQMITSFTSNVSTLPPFLLKIKNCDISEGGCCTCCSICECNPDPNNISCQ
jgi:hypothetical protein